MENSTYDLCVIGGGINGVGVARDAAGRGLSVLLVEADDLGAATSSSSTKLIHGGLRYLEYFEFGLVRDSLIEREVLLGSAPHIISPMRFVLPHDSKQRPAWMIKLGLFLYDHLGGKSARLKTSGMISFSEHEYGAPLRKKYRQGFVYSDCWVDDSRLVVLNAMDAAKKGADIYTRTQCRKLKSRGDGWDISLGDVVTKKKWNARARMVVNAAGPWVREVLEKSALAPEHSNVPHVRLVKGSHIIVKRRYEGDQAYILQQEDGRIVFVIPYEGKYTLVGTTEEAFEGKDARKAQISKKEMAYLCSAYNESFPDEITIKDVLWSYSGVRPLFDDGGEDATSATRDYKLYAHTRPFPPLLSIFGGKLTTYRILAEEAVSKIISMAKFKKAGRRWSAQSALPGGDIPRGDMHVFMKAQTRKYKWLDPALLLRYAHSYGTRMNMILSGASGLKDLGAHYGGGLYEAEVRYLIAHEWARTAEDILWRRTKLGLHVKDTVVEKLEKALPKLLKEFGSDE